MKLASKKVSRNLLAFFLLIGGLLFTRFVLAVDFGTEAVSNGLGGSLAADDPRTIIGRIINIALGILGTVAVALIIWSGYIWMTAGGDEDKITNAKRILKNGVIGLVIILSSWAIATFILNKLGGAVNGNSYGCSDGEIQSCGCGGSMVCSNGAWGGCVGSDPANCITPPITCDSSAVSGCQPANQICVEGYFCDNNCLCQPQGGAGDSCDSDPSNQTCEADNDYCSEYLTCNPETCLCAGPPVITGLSPVGGFCDSDADRPCSADSDCGGADTCNQSAANGTTNNFITVFGKNFGEYSATGSQVLFLGDNNPVAALSPSAINPLCIDSWSDEQIVIAVPAGVQAGPIRVVNGEGLSDQTDDDYGPEVEDFITNDISRPGLCYLNPDKGTLSSEVGYQGINLFSGDAYFGNYQSNVQALDSAFTNPDGLSGTSTIPNIQTGNSGSFVEKVISGFPQKSNYLKFTKDREIGAGPYIISFTPLTGSAGQYVTIRGAGFGGARGNNHVYFASGNNKIEASYSFPAICTNSVWKDNQIIVKVPDGLDNGGYELQVALGTSTISTQNLNPNAFGFDNSLSLKSSLCKIDPGQGPIDTLVTLWGEYFGTPGTSGLARFFYNQDAGGTIAKENDAHKISANVPAAAVTGSVKVVKNNEWGNELNFIVGECTNDQECNNQICCPANTYKHGRCVSSLDECFVDIPTSVFEWGFSTSFDATTTPTFDSCSGWSRYLGSCYLGAMCPNSPGACSSPATNYQKTVGVCDLTCQDAPGCTAVTCTYDETLDRCVQNAANGVCDLPQAITYSILGKTYTTEKTCNSSGQWEIVSPGSCPEGWTRRTGNRCTQNGSGCSLCGSKLSCLEVNSLGRCVSGELCADKGASCVDNPAAGEDDKCVVEVAPSCECCCRIGKDAEDCCAGLTCSGKCGSDLIADSNTYGSCSGCAAAGSTAAARDAACNCTGHTSQYCSVTTEHPEGICTDCAGLADQTECGDHSSACCFDSNRTATTTDDVCRGLGGGSVVNSDPSSSDYGYCAYFNCFSETVPPIGDPLVCASTTPLKIGYFAKVDSCIKDCPSGVGSDPCHAFDDDQVACIGEGACCYDATTQSCISGDKIAGGQNDGYCAYYACQTPPGDPLLCDPTPTTTPIFMSTTSCAVACANPSGGAGLGCVDNNATSTCNFGLCNFPGLACLQSSGAGGAYPDCGNCCCQVGNNPDSCVSSSTPNLHCQADKGSCTGSGRGLCCGCSQDADCGSITTTGCGADTCCQARPSVVSTSPAAADNNVCRNASIRVTFNQNMDITSFGSNFLLFEEKSGGSTCPAGTYIVDARQIEDMFQPRTGNIFARLWRNLSSDFHHWFGRVSDQALATPPDPAKLYCAVSGSVSAENNGSQTDLIFTPVSLLDPAAKYYAVIKGDESLDSQSGVLSFAKIGMNERGLDEGDGTFVAGSQVKFNGHAYLNSYSFQFTTLSDQGVNAGVCAIDSVIISPVSYLFKTTDNDLNENDNYISSFTFDTKADRDKSFRAGAYSVSGQLLHPVSGYYWDWVWSSDNTNIAQVIDVSLPLTASSSESYVPDYQKLVVASAGIVDGQTKVRAAINMDDYRSGSGCTGNCNAYFGGDGETGVSDVYVFICNNPWPAIAVNGTWSPWNDLAGNCSVNTATCEDFNYKFYYCRDAGENGTLDDLPAIVSSPVVRGQSSNLLCSSDRKPCSSFGGACGDDQNGDGNPDGLCFWNVLKESYFFREAVPSSGQIISASDTKLGGEVQINWASPAANTAAYKIYYLKSGQGTMMSKEFAAANACSLSGQTYNCSAKINNLTNNQLYIFKLSVISTARTESALSNEKTATPTDQTRPSAPATPTVEISTSTVKFIWTANPSGEDVSFYRLYHGLNSGVYGESFDSAPGATSLSFYRSQFPSALNYFALTARTAAGQESDKSSETVVDLQ